MRLFGKRDAEYLNAKYNILDTKSQYIEITVADYTANLDNRNIAENFRRKYADHIEFEQLNPEDFFDGKSDNIWREFYKDPQFIAKHFGLRIFAAMVNRYEGAFVMESHSSHKQKEWGMLFIERNAARKTRFLYARNFLLDFTAINRKGLFAGKDYERFDVGVGGWYKEIVYQR